MSRGDAERLRKVKPTARERFLAKCRFNAVTGCVEWVGGKTRGKGKTAWYGSFWDQGRRWLAHRWAAKYIHGLDIEGQDVDHKCGNTLCVQHLQSVTALLNTALYWIRVQVGLIDHPEPDAIDSEGVPYYNPPPWFKEKHDEAVRNDPFGGSNANGAGSGAGGSSAS